MSVVTDGFGLQCLLSQRNGVVSSPARCPDQDPLLCRSLVQRASTASTLVLSR